MTNNPPDVERLKEALRPFARVCAAFDYWCPEVMPDFAYPVRGTSLDLQRQDAPQAAGELTEADFRRAAEALATLSHPHPADGEADPFVPREPQTSATALATPLGSEATAGSATDVEKRTREAAEAWRVPCSTDPNDTELCRPKDDCVWGFEQGYAAALSTALSSSRAEALEEAARVAYPDPLYMGGNERDENDNLPPGSPYDCGRYHAARDIRALIAKESE